MGNETVDTNEQTSEFARKIQQALEFFRTGDENPALKDGDVQIAIVSEDFPDYGIPARERTRFRITGDIIISEGQPLTRFAVAESVDNSPWREIGAGIDIGQALGNAKLALDKEHTASAEFTPS